MNGHVELCDVTPRDGDQSYGVNLNAADKLWFAGQDDTLGLTYVEGGFPASNAVDEDVFRRLREEPLRQSILTAFGMTCRKSTNADQDPGLRKLVALQPPAVTLVGKTARSHVTDALHTTPQENIRMVQDSIRYLLSQGVHHVLFDAEHFFDGYCEDPEHALAVLDAAREAGAGRLVLCDTKGGSTPEQVGSVVEAARMALGKDVILGIHPHNDRGLAVGNMRAAVQAGVRHVQGTWNGLGERTGNLDLCQAIPNLHLDGYETVPVEHLARLTEMSESAAFRSKQWRNPFQPFTGKNGFAHKGGMHASAVAWNPSLYEFTPPETWGNERIIADSKQSGLSNTRHAVETSTLLTQEQRQRLLADPRLLQQQLDATKKKEGEGFNFDRAPASRELLILRAQPEFQPFIRIHRCDVHDTLGQPTMATMKVSINGSDEPSLQVGEDFGPIGALSEALLKSLRSRFPDIDTVSLVDFETAIAPQAHEGTHSAVIVTVEYRSGDERWFTVGVSRNSIEAGWSAVLDGLEYWLQKNRGRLQPSNGKVSAENSQAAV